VGASIPRVVSSGIEFSGCVAALSIPKTSPRLSLGRLKCDVRASRTRYNFVGSSE
jgi:hypothetical protein